MAGREIRLGVTATSVSHEGQLGLAKGLQLGLVGGHSRRAPNANLARKSDYELISGYVLRFSGSETHFFGMTGKNKL